jgi:hypothetical protein
VKAKGFVEDIYLSSDTDRFCSFVDCRVLSVGEVEVPFVLFVECDEDQHSS